MTIKARILGKIENILDFLSPDRTRKEKAYKKYISQNISQGKKVLAEMKLIPMKRYYPMKEFYMESEEFFGYFTRREEDEYEIIEGIRLIGLRQCYFYRIRKNGLVAYEENPSFPKIGVKEFYQELVELYVSSLKVEQS